MNATELQAGYRPAAVQESTITKTMAGTAIGESVGAIATIALAIVGLAGAHAMTVAAIAMIVLGAAIWLEGGAFVAMRRGAYQGEGFAARTLEWSEGLDAEFLGGLSGIVLGILALLGIAPITLLSVAALAVGTLFLFGSSSETGVGSSGQMLFGLAGAVLGLLAVCGLSSLTLVLVSLLCLGASAFFSGAAVGARAAVQTSR